MLGSSGQQYSAISFTYGLVLHSPLSLPIPSLSPHFHSHSPVPECLHSGFYWS